MITKTVRVFSLIFICLIAMVAQAAADLRKQLQITEGTQELVVLAKHIITSPNSERKARLDELIQIVQESADSGKPSHGQVGQVAFLLVQIGDKESIINAFANNLERFDRPDQIDATEALSSCASERAANAIAKLARERLKRLPSSMPANPSKDQKRALNDDVVDFIKIMTQLQRCGDPGRNLVKAIRSEVVAKAETSSLLKQVLPVLDSELLKISPPKTQEIQ